MADAGNSQVPPLGGLQSGNVTGGLSPGLVLGIVDGIAILGVSAVVYRQMIDLQGQVTAYKNLVDQLNQLLGRLGQEVSVVNTKIAMYEKIIKRIPKMRGEFFQITEADRQEWQEGFRRSNDNFNKLKGEKDVPLLDVANIQPPPIKRVQINGDRPAPRRDVRPVRRNRRPSDEDDYAEDASESDDVDDYIRELGGNSRRSK
jgi:hypothetical protein